MMIPLLEKYKDELKSKLVWFSVDNNLTKGVYIEGKYIVINDGKFLG